MAAAYCPDFSYFHILCGEIINNSKLVHSELSDAEKNNLKIRIIVEFYNSVKETALKINI